jgi:ABC-2 type transport system ATP-binding protein
VDDHDASLAGVIDVRGVEKNFGSTRALDGLNLTVAAGQIHGFLGPNGAGKTTTIRLLLGLLRRDAGHATLFGSDPWTDSVALHRRLSYVPGEVSLWPSLSGGECIDYLLRLRGGADRSRVTQLQQQFDLNPRTKVSSYSKGNRQKVALIAALAVDVELYIFDEPTDGLDPLMAEAFREQVYTLRERGRTVLLSSHVLAEVDAVCDHVTIIRDGRTIETGALSELRHLQRQSLTIETKLEFTEISGIPGVHDVECTNNIVRCTVEPTALNEVLTRASAAHVINLETRSPSLEEMFLRYYDRDVS